MKGIITTTWSTEMTYAEYIMKEQERMDIINKENDDLMRTLIYRAVESTKGE